MQTCSIIVSFNPNITNITALAKSLARQGSSIIVIDNNSNNKYLLQKEILKIKKTKIIILDKNTGISHAQNIGIENAQTEKYSHVFFFDQDSTIDDEYTKKQMQVFYEIKTKQPNLAALGPALIDKKHGFNYKIINITQYGRRRKVSTQSRNEPFPASLIISSGSLVSVDALREIGPMDERFFIDYVDTEWCLRAHAKGYCIYINPQVKMLHSIGDKSLKLLKWRVPVHSPFRRYYRIRNALFLLEMPHVPTLLALREIIFNLVHQVVIILCEKNKMAYVRSLWRGLRDGLNGKY